MGSWTTNRLRAMLCGRLSIDEINIISEKHGGPDTMFAMVRSLDEEQAKIFLYNILNEGLSARLLAFAETVNVSENDLQQVIDHYGGPSNLCDVLDFYSWPTLTFFPTMLKFRKECPVNPNPAEGGPNWPTSWFLDFNCAVTPNMNTWPPCKFIFSLISMENCFFGRVWPYFPKFSNGRPIRAPLGWFLRNHLFFGL